MTYSKVLNARLSVFRSVMLLMAAGNVPVNKLLAKLMLCKSTEVLFTCATKSYNVLLVLYAEHDLCRTQSTNQ